MQILRIKQERIKKGLRQQDIADNFGVTKTCISDLENGKATPSYKLLLRLEDFFNLSHCELFKYVDEIQSHKE